MPLFRDYKPGDWYGRCQRTGRKYLMSDLRREWNGLWVHKSVWEPRHPQDFVRGRKDKITASPNSPDLDPIHVTTLVSKDDL